MTISKAASGNGSFLIGPTSSPKSAERQGAEVIYREFAAARALPLANTKSLAEVIGRLERNGAIASRLPEARRRVGRALYGGEASLAALRLRAGLSQAQLAEKIGSSQPHIARIERGQNDPSTDLVVRIARALGVSTADVFDGVQAHRRAVSEAV
jgi:DNA-binding XRE family transcriptional regulator